MNDLPYLGAVFVGLIGVIELAFYMWARRDQKLRFPDDGDVSDIVATTTPPLPPEPPPLPPNPAPMLDFSTPKKAYKSTRILCDEMGLPLQKTVMVNGTTYFPKDIICATIFGESEFDNTAVGRNAKSVDYGIAQFNDGPPSVPPDKKWYIGPGKLFSSPQDVFDNPERAIRYVIGYWKAHGNLNPWYAYSKGRYKQFLPKTSRMWLLAKP